MKPFWVRLSVRPQKVCSQHHPKFSERCQSFTHSKLLHILSEPYFGQTHIIVTGARKCLVDITSDVWFCTPVALLVKSPKLHFSIKSTAKSSPFSWFQLAIKQAPGSLRLQLHSCPMSLILFNLGHQEDPREISSFSQVYPPNFLTWHIMAPKYIYI